MNKKIISIFICLLLMDMIPVVAGMNNYKDKIETESSNTPILVQVKTNNTDSNSAITWNGFNWHWHIDNDGYFILNVTNLCEYDIYNISFDIEFVGGVLFFKVNSETDAFVDHLPSGETVEVKSNDPIVKPKPIVRRPLFFGHYLLTIDETINGTYVGQGQFRVYGLFIYLIIL